MLLTLLTCAPGLGVGALLGALTWRAHRAWGALLGASVGGAAAAGAFVVWEDSHVSMHMGFRDAVSLWIAIPGLLAGAAICAWRWRGGRVSRADLGALAGGLVWMGGWWGLTLHI